MVFTIQSITHVPSSMEQKKDPIKSYFLYISIFHFHITMITTGATSVLCPLYYIFIWTMLPLLAYWNTMLVSKALLRTKYNIPWYISYPYPVFLPQKKAKLTICFGQIQFSWQWFLSSSVYKQFGSITLSSICSGNWSCAVWHNSSGLSFCSFF